jgi:hypothetical protein
MFLITDPTEEANISVWIYKKKKSILLFAKEKLVSHFSFKELRHALEGNKGSDLEEPSEAPIKIPSL